MFGRRAARERFEQAHARRFAANADGVVVGAEDIRLPHASGRAALVLHGFNDTPQSMAYLATRLHEAGWSVLAPRLPGHGVRLPLMARDSRAALWRQAVAAHYSALRAEHDIVVVCGQSMGGALATLLAAAHPEIPALVLLAPYLSMPWSIQLRTALAWVLQLTSPYFQGSGGDRSLHDAEAKARALGPGVITARTMTELRAVARAAEAVLPTLRVPTLYMQSREDNRISEADARRHFAAIGSPDKVMHWLSGCGHIISADYGRDEVAAETIAWFEQHAALHTPQGVSTR